MVYSKVYLAVVEDPSLWDTTEQVLVLFLEDDAPPPNELVNPTVVGLQPAEGVWQLLFWHEPSRRAFYEEIPAQGSVRPSVLPVRDVQTEDGADE